MRALEWIVWRLIWATHWTGMHQTFAVKGGKRWVWCADCLRPRRAMRTVTVPRWMWFSVIGLLWLRGCVSFLERVAR